MKLEEAGWQILSRQSGNQVHLTYIDPDGKKYKSSKDMERKLNADGALFQFRKPEIENVEKAAVTMAQTVEAVHEESDEDYAIKATCRSGCRQIWVSRKLNVLL